MSTFLFPDVNVWLALAHKVHPHHRYAIRWGQSVDASSHFYFCRFSQLSVLRLLTNRSTMGADVVSQAQAWQIYDLFYENGMTFFIEEPHGLEAALRKITSRSTSSVREWSDSYLGVFAELTGLQLVTFDRALSRRTKHSILIEASDSL